MSEGSLTSQPFRLTADLLKEVARSRVTRRSFYVFYFGAIGVCVFSNIAAQVLAPDNGLLRIVVGTLAVVGVFATMQIAQTKSREWQIKSSLALRGDMTVSIDADGVHAKTAHTYGRVAWPAVVQVRETAQAILIFTHPLQAYPVPRASFASPQEARAFAAAAHSFWRTAHPDTQE